MTLDVLGAGFGRTGTTSLQHALEFLGYRPCHHMEEVFAHPDQIGGWHAAARGEEIDWQALLSPYKAAIGWPTCHFWRQLMDAFPAAKIILTVRDPDAWWRSFSKTVALDYAKPPPDNPGLRRWYDMVEEIIARQTFGGRPNDRETAIAAFHTHISEVIETVPEERLLVFGVQEGWGPLCRFLDHAVPATPFPSTNSVQEFLDAQSTRRANLKT